MKKKLSFILCIISLMLFVSISPAYATNSNSKGTAWVLSDTNVPTPMQIYSNTYVDPSVTNSTFSGSADIFSLCNNVSINGTYTNVPASSSLATATVYERRYTDYATVSDSLGIGTYVGSKVEYYIHDILNGPTYDLTGVGMVRSDWEISITSGTPATYRGTTYYYYKNNVFFGGYVEGDITGGVFYVNASTPTRNIIITKVNGTPFTGNLTMVFDPSQQKIELNEYTAGGIGIHSNVGIYYQGNVTATTTYSGSCLSTPRTSNHQGLGFYIPPDTTNSIPYNVGLSLVNWQSTTTTDTGTHISYNYKTLDNTDVIPRIIGLSQTGAQDILSFHGFTLGSVTPEFSSTYPAGAIIRQNLKAGAVMTLGTPVNIVVSNAISVPNVVGMTQTNATSAITGAGLSLGAVTPTNNPAPAGQVISQTPTTGTLTAPGSTVALTVSLGPASTSTTTYTLSTSVSSGNGTISPATGTYNQGTVVTLTATPDSGYQVKAWHGTNNDASTALTNSVTMSANRSVTVDFTVTINPETTYTLTVSIPNGHGTVTPMSGTYNQGTPVSLSATPESGYKLKFWQGTDNDGSTSSSNTVTMNANRTVTVEFEPVSSDAEENDDDKKDDKKTGCFITTSSSDPFSHSGILILSLFCIVSICIPKIRKGVLGA